MKMNKPLLNEAIEILKLIMFNTILHKVETFILVNKQLQRNTLIWSRDLYTCNSGLLSAAAGFKPTS